MPERHNASVSRLICLFILLSFILASKAAKIGDVYLVHSHVSDNNDELPGSCGREARDGKTYGEILESWWDDVSKLIKHTNQGMKRYNADDQQGHIIRENLLAWFGIRWKNREPDGDRQLELEEIQKTFEILEELVDGKHGWEMGWNEQEKRQIYCDSDWLPETTLVYNEDGKAVKDSKGEDLNIYKQEDVESENSKILNHFLKHYSYRRRTGLSIDTSAGKIRAYWSKYHKAYVYEEEEGGKLIRYNEEGDERHYCHGVEGMPYPGTANTDSQSFGKMVEGEEEQYTPESVLVMTFCPNAFKQLKVDTSDESVAQWGNRKKLVDVQPRSLTLLHELVHVINGPVSTPDDLDATQEKWRDMYGPDKLLTASKDKKAQWDMSNLPESYAFYAFSYWASTDDQAGDLYDWTTGRAKPLKKEGGGS